MRALLTTFASLALTAALAGGAVASPRHDLTAAAGVDSAYDGNVFNGRGPDFVNRITPHFSWRVVDPRYTVETDYDLGIWTYAFGKASNSINHRALASVEA